MLVTTDDLDAVSISGISALSYGVLPEIDQPSMSARFRICTARMDHEGDIIEPSGVDWEDYRFNPVVKYEHGITGIPFPVARSADDNGVLHEDWDPDEDAIYSRAFFSDKYELSEQCFGLIVDGFMRAASIHVMPADGKWKVLGGGGHHVFGSNQMEWSVAAVGINPDAYVKSLSADSKLSEFLALQLESAERILKSGKVGGRAIRPELIKCLTAVRPPRQPLVRGNSTKEEGDMAKTSMTAEEVATLSVVGLAKALGSAGSYDAPTLKLLTSKAKSLDLTKADGDYKDDDDDGSLAKADTDEELDENGNPKRKADEPGEITGDVVDPVVEEPAPSSMSPGADFLSALHLSVGDLCAKLDSVDQYTEKPEVQEIAAKICEDLRAELATLEGAFSTIYPEQEPLVAAEEPAETEMVKAWVASNSRAGFQLRGLAVRADRAAANPKLSKSLLKSISRDLRLLESQAKSWKPSAGKQPASQEDFDKLVESVSKFMDAWSSQPAPIGR